MPNTKPVSDAASAALEGTRLGFIGGGVMAEAMIAGLLDRRLVAPDQIIVSHPRAERRDELSSRHWVRSTDRNQEVPSKAT